MNSHDYPLPTNELEKYAADLKASLIPMEKICSEMQKSIGQSALLKEFSAMQDVARQMAMSIQAACGVAYEEAKRHEQLMKAALGSDAIQHLVGQAHMAEEAARICTEASTAIGRELEMSQRYTFGFNLPDLSYNPYQAASSRAQKLFDYINTESTSASIFVRQIIQDINTAGAKLAEDKRLAIYFNDGCENILVTKLGYKDPDMVIIHGYNSKRDMCTCHVHVSLVRITTIIEKACNNKGRVGFSGSEQPPSN